MSVFRRTIELISPQQRPAMAGLFVLMLFGMVIETLGVGSVLPAVAAMTDASFSQNLPDWLPMHDTLAGMPNAQLIVFVLLGLVGLFAFKAVFMAFLASRQASFLYDAQADISRRLFSGYLRQSYAFHLRRNSAQLIRNVTSETTAFTIGSLQASMVLLTEGMVALGLGALLVLIEPVGALSVILVLGGAGALFLMFTRKHLKRWGERRQYHEGQRIQHLQQGLGGAKDVKLLGREEHFLSEYDEHNLMVARLGKREMVVQALPRLWLELLAVLGLAILVFAHLAQGKAMDSLVPTLGVFAAAAYRLVPSANRILNAIQGIRFYQPVVDILFAELSVVAAPQTRSSPSKSDFQASIEFRNVSYNYPESSGVALENINLVVPKNVSVGIVGESGAGKSTLIDVLMGLLTPSGGQVLIDGKDIQNDLRDWQDQFGYVPQAIFLTDDTLRRNIAFGIPDAEIDDVAVQKAVVSAQLESFVSSLPEAIESQVGERGVRLSGGQRQRIGIARALYHDPSILVLDEATSSLDTDTEAEIMRCVKSLRDKTIFIVAHRHSTVEHCETVFQLAKGRLVAQGKLDTVLGANAAASNSKAI